MAHTLRLLGVLLISVSLAGCPQIDSDANDGPVADAGSLVQCVDGIDNDEDGQIDGADPDCTGPDDDDESMGLTAQCADELDNDADGQVDLDDPGCDDANDNDESDEPVTPQCRDGMDNDGDGDTDLADAGCGSPDDNDESDDPPPPVLPQCANGEDDDMDGAIDFPADPGCGSDMDDDESNDSGPVRPQCSNGIDDDNDGLVDLADPGCSSVADPREASMDEELPQCADGIDNDGDGNIDFPYDPGCSAAGDNEEVNPPNPPECGDEEDNDGDGAVDFPFDPGCAGVGDRDETDPVIPPVCSDGVDNDRDGQTDYPDDRGCTSAAAGAEGGACGRTYDPAEVEAGRVLRGDSRRGAYQSEGSCGGRGSPEVVFVYRVDHPIEALVIRSNLSDNEVESAIYVRRGCLDPATEIVCVREPLDDGVAANEVVMEAPTPGDYYVFFDGATGRGGTFALVIEEIALAQCLNGEDDDGDGRVDFPNDPGCGQPDDRDETDPAVYPSCSDDEDNDGDGAIDFPLDFGCTSAADGDEEDLCGQGLRIYTYPVGRPFIIDTTEDGTSAFDDLTCTRSTGPEKIFVYENPNNANITFSVDHEQTVGPTAVEVRTNCLDAGSAVGCNAGGEGGQRGTVTLERAGPGTYFVFVDAVFGLGGLFKLSVEIERLPAGCDDGIDNDEDGFIDFDDVGCADTLDEDERDPVGGDPPACWDQLDNDEDGVIDYPFEPGCFGKGDDDETDPDVLPQCANGVDDDEDGHIDVLYDRGCASAGDDDERNPRRQPQCDNRIDDDMDGVTDYPSDPGCATIGDFSERDDARPPACADRIDNDLDAMIDFPYDPGCIAAGHTDETDPDEPAACSNGIDDDEDDVIDFPFEPGCLFAADDDERDPGFPPQCANGVDDDADGLIDFPDDRGCRFVGDRNEVDPFIVPARCEDSIDNDADGAIDLRDQGCTNRDDDDEADDPAAPTECANEVDDDEDGLVDWPDDPGCQAAGDGPEAQTCADAEVLEIGPEGSVMGATVDGGPDRFRNNCGGREAPDVVYRYDLAEAGVLRISADNEGTDYPVVLSVTRDCDEARALVACAGDFRNPSPAVVIPNAEPGEYYIIVDGGGPERWVSGGGAIALPPDPRNFVARNDLNAQCWSDGGNDAFDCYGRFNVEVGGAAAQLDVSPGEHAVNIGGVGMNYTSELVGNVWRLSLRPVVENDERPVNITITGNLGSDGSTQTQQMQTQYQGRQINWFYTSDGRPSDPPVHHLLLPSDPEHLPRVGYAANGDNVTVSANNLTLPVTWYVALSYADRNAVIAGVIDDIEIQAGGGGADAPRFGNFELTVSEE